MRGNRPELRLARIAAKLSRKRRVDLLQLFKPFLYLAFLPFQETDLLQALLPAERQRVAIGRGFLGGDHLADFAQREPELFSLQDQCETGPISLRIEPVQAVAMGRDKSLVLVEA